MLIRNKTMSEITQCPDCSTRFRVSQSQLDMYQGMVRCGRCQCVFNATTQLHDNEPSPQLTLALILDEIQAAPPLQAAPIELQAEPIESPVEQTAPTPDTYNFSQFVIPNKDELPQDNSGITKRKARWPGIAITFLLFIVLLAQTAYFLRVELATYFPGIKPTLVSYCELIGCNIPLPQKIDLLSLESSELESDTKQTGVIMLNALLRNRAPYAQAYPNLELTFTNSMDEVLARRIFPPAEYLKPTEDEKQGISPNYEMGIKLYLNTTDIKPTGYRLFLFYP
jgi:predicted Zn finger-like uncharacterized protein